VGKSWACWRGASASRGAILVFLDADVRLEPGGLNRLMAEQRRCGGLLSVWPYHRMRRPYERLSAFFLLIVLAGMRCFTILGRRLEPLGAFGPCMAALRTDYFAAGGHEAVRGAILDDVALGRRFQAAGIPVHCLRGAGTVAFRMYPRGPRDLVEGFTKNFGLGFRTAGAFALVPTFLWIAGFFLAAGRLLIALVLPDHPGLTLWAVGYLLYAGALAWQLRRLGNYGPFTALLFPVPLLFFAAVFLLSLARTFVWKTVRWKERTISLERRP
jgi:4,4'-diaponeurosporenoate glycosyltransferase